MGCTVTPSLQVPLPRIQYPQGLLVRCLYCKAYLSPYCTTDLSANTWICGVCTYNNPISESSLGLFSNTRVEFSQCNYEIYAEEKYMNRPPMCPTYLFVLDISEASSESGFLQCAVIAILKTVREKKFQGEERTCVGFILFDKHAHFVRIGKRPEIITMTCPEGEAWLPAPEYFLAVNIEDNFEDIICTLEIISNIKGDQKSSGLKMAILACDSLLENSGGRVLIFLCNSMIESAHPKKLSFMATTDFYHTIGEKFSMDSIRCDMFISSVMYCGVFTLGELSKITGGEVHYYPNFSSSRADALQVDVYSSISRETAWEAGLKMRTGNDWKVIATHGHFHKSKKDILIIPCLTESSYTFELSPIYAENTDHFLCVQAALLYTSSDGIRLIRVMNYQLPVSDDIEEILKSIHCDTLVNLLFKQALVLIFKSHVILSGQRNLEAKAIEILKNCLLAFRGLPRNLKDFLRKVLGLMKHQIFVSSILPCKCN